MFPAILNILKESDGYVHFSDVCKSLERTPAESVPSDDKNRWYRTVLESLNLAHSQGLAFRSDDGRYRFAVNLHTSEDPKLLARIDALKVERRQEAEQVAQCIRPEPVEEVAGPSGYAYRMVPQEPLEMVSEVASRKKGRSKEKAVEKNKSKKRSRSRSSKGARKSKN